MSTLLRFKAASALTITLLLSGVVRGGDRQLTTAELAGLAQVVDSVGLSTQFYDTFSQQTSMSSRQARQVLAVA